MTALPVAPGRVPGAYQAALSGSFGVSIAPAALRPTCSIGTFISGAGFPRPYMVIEGIESAAGAPTGAATTGGAL